MSSVASPKVSVLLITYNHAAHIAQAIDSVLMQRTTFPIEIVIGEDCSTDGTRDIVKGYARNHPDVIRALLPEANQGAFRNVVSTLEACRGQYVAALEGDDYWTDPDKLKHQVDYLDTHPECAISFHKVQMVFEEANHPPREVPQRAKEFSSIEDLLVNDEGNLIPTCSAVWRRGFIDHLPDWIEEVRFSDWPIHVLNARHGNIAFIDRCMGAYRIHPCGTWSTQSGRTVTERWVKAYTCINSDLDYRYNRLCQSGIFKRLSGYALDSLGRGEPDAASYAWRAIRTGPPHLHASRKLILLLKMYAPSLLRAAGGVKRILAGPSAPA